MSPTVRLLELARFLAAQVLGLGCLAFIAWALFTTRGNWTFLLSWDALFALVFGVALTALFVPLVALPAQSVLPGEASLPARLLVGCFSGPLGVWLGLLAFTKYPPESYSYIDRAWPLHLVYAVVGGCFAWAWHRRSAAGNSKR
jgi:hypothetical protein